MVFVTIAINNGDLITTLAERKASQGLSILITSHLCGNWVVELVQGMVLKKEGNQNLQLERQSEITPETIEEKLTFFQVLSTWSSPQSFLSTVAHWNFSYDQKHIKIYWHSYKENHWTFQSIIPSLEGQLLSMIHANLSKVYVTFNKESEQRACLAAMTAGKWSCFTNPATVFRSKVSLLNPPPLSSSHSIDNLYPRSHRTLLHSLRK